MKNAYKQPVKLPVYHTLLGIDFHQWLSMNRQNGLFSLNRFNKGLFLTIKSLRNTYDAYYEARQYGPAIDGFTIKCPPIFILGHWRSGTTFLEYILSQDPTFRYLDIIQSLYPKSFLSKWNYYANSFREIRRPMDNIPYKANAPSEEEAALAILASGSLYHGYYFPKNMDYHFHKYVLFKGISFQELEKWKQAYLYLLKKLSLFHQGKPLLLKNPPNTCRIKVLLEMFPHAKFIHIHRNPYEVFLSRMHQYENWAMALALQPISKSTWEERVLRYYPEMMDAHFSQRESIPKGQYIEISFEALKSQPLDILAQIYNTLGLGEFSQAKPYFETYLQSLKDYKQNEYTFERAVIDKVYKNWHQTIDLWGYQTPKINNLSE